LDSLAASANTTVRSTKKYLYIKIKANARRFETSVPDWSGIWRIGQRN